MHSQFFVFNSFRLDSDDKQFGYIVDYKYLFRKGEDTVAVYTSELDYDNFRKEDVDVLLKDRLKTGRERLAAALEEIALLCEPVAPPKDSLAYFSYSRTHTPMMRTRFQFNGKRHLLQRFFFSSYL